MTRLRDNWLALAFVAACIVEGVFILGGPRSSDRSRPERTPESQGDFREVPVTPDAGASAGESLTSLSPPSVRNRPARTEASGKSWDSLADVLAAIKSWDSRWDATRAYELVCELSRHGALSCSQQEELLAIFADRIQSTHEGERYCWVSLCELLPPERVRRALLDAAEFDDSPWVRSVAILAFARVGGLEVCRSTFENAYRSNDRGVRTASLKAVSTAPLPYDLPVFAESLGPDRWPDEQRAAVKGLARLGTPQAMATLRTAVIECRDRQTAELLWNEICHNIRPAELDRSFLAACEWMLKDTRRARR